jgi:hypothetical protein
MECEEKMRLIPEKDTQEKLKTLRWAHGVAVLPLTGR